MKRLILLGIGIGLGILLTGCAEKPMAKSVIGLAGNMKVAGWDVPNEKNQTYKPKIVVKEVVKYKYLPLQDNDKDGVPNYLDKCPNTPKGLTVDHNGCPIITTLRINFDFNKWKVKKIYYPEVEKVAEILKANPHIKKVEVAGYTDNMGSAKYNLWLSKKRAEAVAKLLVKFGVSPKRLIVKGYGEKYPLVPNTTETNRALNRRVEIVNITNSK
ncbi:OmpA family protein [Caminibacter sp.]